MDLAHESGAYSFYTGRTMYTGNAVKTWHAWHRPRNSTRRSSRFYVRRPLSIAAGCACITTKWGCWTNSATACINPAALLIVLPNGLVKLINALPFVCGDLRRQPLEEIWANFQRAWADPRVANFIEDLASDARKTSTLHQWIYL